MIWFFVEYFDALIEIFDVLFDIFYFLIVISIRFQMNRTNHWCFVYIVFVSNFCRFETMSSDFFWIVCFVHQNVFELIKFDL